MVGIAAVFMGGMGIAGPGFASAGSMMGAKFRRAPAVTPSSKRRRSLIDPKPVFAIPDESGKVLSTASKGSRSARVIVALPKTVSLPDWFQPNTSSSNVAPVREA